MAAILLMVLILAGSILLPLRSRGFVLGAAIHFLLVIAGVFLSAIHAPSSGKNWLGFTYQPGDRVMGTISTELVVKKNSCQAEMEVKWLLRHNEPVKASGRVLLYFSKSDSALSVAGVDLLLTSPLQIIQNRSNPGGFNFQQFEALKGIYYQSQAIPGSYVLLGCKRKFNSVQILSRIRKNILSVIRQNIAGNEEKALAEALLIGYREDLEKTLTQAYSNTGVIHVIAISGLHLGVIYWLLSVAFRPLNRKNTRFLPPLLTIACLWLFTLLCGASPSVVRSAVMFSFICLGEVSNRKMTIYNSLAASAFFLLCLQPAWLWDIGFQLSYLAVLSMVIFMKPIEQCLELSNPLLEKLWKMMAGTLAAQILTTPVCIYYFHQFPLLFLLTNLVAIPLSTLVLLCELLLLAASAWTPVASLLGKVTSFGIQSMNGFVTYMSEYPFAIWKGLVISIPQMLLLYGGISFLACFLISQHKKSLMLAALSFIFFLTIRVWSFVEASHQQELIVLNSRGFPAICLIEGQRGRMMGPDSLFYGNPRSSIVDPMLTVKRIKQLEKIDIPNTGARLFMLNGKSIMVIARSDELFIQQWPKRLDILVVSSPCKMNMHEILTKISVGRLVIDASVSKRKAAQLTALCRLMGVAVHAVSDQGAFAGNLSSLTFAPRKTPFR